MSDAAFVATAAIPSAAPPPSPRKHWTGSRIAGTLLMGIWIALGIGFAFLIVGGYDAEKVARYLPRIIGGVWVTVQLVVLSVVFGAILSIPITLGRLSYNWVAAPLAFGFSYFFRGTPLLAQTFLLYYGLGSFPDLWKSLGLWWFMREAFYCAVLAFSLNTAAYQAEILAGAIRSVPRGQWQAAASLGLGRYATLRKVILPQAMITALRPYGNEIVLMIKGSAIAGIVTVFDLMGETRYAYSKTYDFQVYLWAAVLYFLMVEVLRRVWDAFEFRLTRHLRRDAV
ncbi:ABC transporter permease [Chthonobacter albigriseus]|uniref:ABC transporter permease n=1 Tax=Chthonobacter albigriseus TaxID=1683161 RepID=UPI0015EF2E20|nr:ABC transporter permease [Chthonobacter albigriseus]